MSCMKCTVLRETKFEDAKWHCKTSQPEESMANK